MRKDWILYGVAGALGLSVVGCVDRNAQAQAKRTAVIATDTTRVVTLAAPTQQTLTETLEITGQIETSLDSAIGAKQSGRLIEVLVKDGDAVTAGQVIARQDTTQAAAQLNQALAQLQTAQASLRTSQSQLSQAVRNAAINPGKSQAQVRSAEASLRSAKAQLQKTLAGARPEERRQAESTVASAKAALETQRKQLDRIRTLVNEGAVAGSQLDTQLAAYESALAQYQNAQEAVNIQRVGNRPEDIATAREQVRQAEEALQTAKANQSLDPTYEDQVNVARSQVDSSRAQIANAQAQVRIAQQALDDATIRSPFNGRISGSPTQVGTIAGPGTVIARIVGGAGSYFEGEIPERQVPLISTGSGVQVTVESLGATVAGRVAAVSPRGASIGRQFTARISLQSDPVGLRPGMFARGTVVLRQVAAKTVVPESAVLDREGRSIVYTVANGAARQLVVEKGLRGNGVVEVKGLPENTQIIVQGQQSVEDGMKVRVEGGRPVAANGRS